MKFVLVAAVCLLALPGSNAQGGLSSSLGAILKNTGISKILNRVLRPVGELVDPLGELIGKILQIPGKVVAGELSGEAAGTQLDEAIMKFKEETAKAGGLVQGVGSALTAVLKVASGLLKPVFKLVAGITRKRGSGGAAEATTASGGRR